VASIQIVSGNNQTTAVNGAFSNPIVVATTDAQGNPVSGITVSFAVTSGSAILTSASAATNAQGLAGTIVIAPSNPGSSAVTASYGSLSVTFSLTVAQGPASATIQILAGNNQTGTVGQAFIQPIVVEVVDSVGNPASGVTVNFAVIQGSATLSTPSVVTNAQGQASTSVTAGQTAGPIQVRVTSPATSSINTFSLIAQVTIASIKILSGNGQTATGGTAFSQPLAVRVNKNETPGMKV
jgi:5-hydroxyisourate hydrolase-like protein (transthyretin family)